MREVAKFKDTCVCQPEVIMSLGYLTVSSSVLSSWAAKCDIDRLLSRGVKSYNRDLNIVSTKNFADIEWGSTLRNHRKIK